MVSCVCVCVICTEYLTVDETAKEPPQIEDGINSPQKLAMEATYINQTLSQQVLMVNMCMCTVYCIFVYVY